jgi:hypothetical protein
MKIPSLAIIAATVIAASAGAMPIPQNTEDKSQQIVTLSPAIHQGAADLTAGHFSHSSHASHASHASHSSHFSGR